jgi:hypothetical protein
MLNYIMGDYMEEPEARFLTSEASMTRSDRSVRLYSIKTESKRISILANETGKLR